MNLRRQLLLVSLLTLILPWAGCQFIRETESALREGQQQMLSGTAQALAESLSQFPDAMLAGYDDNRFGENQLYGQTLQSAPLIDGYLDDWTIPDDAAATLRGTDGAIRYVLGLHGQYLYLHVDVRDTAVIFADLQDSSSADQFSDYVSLTSITASGERDVFRFRAEAPGKLVATRQSGTQHFDELRVVAHWLDTANGYRLEARLPRNILGRRLGLTVINTDDRNNRGIPSATFDGTVPGPMMSISPLLQSVASGYRQPGMRLMITNLSGWRLALTGDVAGSSTIEGSRNNNSAWLRLVYKALLEPGTATALAEPDPRGRERQSYISAALDGAPTSHWFRSPDTGTAVVAVAWPIWSGTVQTGAIVLQQGTDAILSLTNQSLARLITLTLISTIGVALILLGYANWLSSRIRRLSNAAENALDERRIRSALPSALASDEVGDLSRSFSNVLRQLGDYNDYLRTLASKLSHELRTPLTIVKSSLENLEHENLSADALKYTARAREGTERLRKILNAMSEANRTEELIENAEPEAFDIGAVLESTVAAYADAWPERQFEFRHSGAATLAWGSPELIIQMLDKLADNAVEFSTPGDHITIGLETEADQVVITVTNPGQPLPDNMRARLFQSMVSVRRGDGGKSGEHLGLGLYIARLIAQGHEGSIDAENTADGVSFTIRLPIDEPVTDHHS